PPRAIRAVAAPRGPALDRTQPPRTQPRRGRCRRRAAAAARSLVPHVDDEPRGIVESLDAEVDALLDADRPREHGLEVPGADDLADDRGAAVGSLDPARALVDEAPLVRREVESRRRLHPHEQDRTARDLDRVSRAVLDDRPVDVLDLPARPQ